MDSPYYKGHCKVMCVSFAPIFPCDNEKCTPDVARPRLKTRKELELERVQATSMTMTTKVLVGCLIGCSKRCQTDRRLGRETEKKPAQLKKNDNHATQDVKVQEFIMEGKCVAGPILTQGSGEGLYSEEVLWSRRKTDYQRELCRKVLHEEWITLSGTSRGEDKTKFKAVSGS